MSDDDEEYDDENETNNKKEDEALMHNLIQSIQALKQETCECEDQQEISDSPESEEPKAQTPEANDSPGDEPIDLDKLPLIELRNLLDQVNKAMDYNNQMQGQLLMKEVRLMGVKRMIEQHKSEAKQKQRQEEPRTDVGRYVVKFKAPYFKNLHNFATYVIVPESQMPVTAQRFESPAGQWNKAALKDLESCVRTFLTTMKLRESMRLRKPKTLREKERLIARYHYTKNQASMSSLVDEHFDRIIDWHSVSSRMKKEFNPNECQKAWNIFLRPDINRKKWTVAEKENLKKVALRHNYEDWDTIAWEMGTNRNGYQCFHIYVDKIMKSAEGDWSVAEEDFLTKLVKECTYGDKVMWHKVAYFFETRTITQIYRKWTLSCVGKEVVAGAFTEDEDRAIMDMLIVRKGQFSINQVAKKLNRISSQIRYRFAQLKSSLKHKYGEWSLEEDKKLLDLVEKFGKKSWSKIAEHMPERGRVQIRHRYTNLRKRLATNPELSIENLARFKRPVHSKRKETNIKCLMELSGIEETPGDDLNEERDTKDSVTQAVEQIIGPDEKKKRRHPMDPRDLSPCRFPDLEEDPSPQFPLDGDMLVSSPEPEQDPLKSPEAPKKPVNEPPHKKTRKKRTSTKSTGASAVPEIPPGAVDNEAPGPAAEPEPKPKPEPVPDPELKPRPFKLYQPILEYYTMASDFCGELAKPMHVQSGRKPSRAETLNSVLKFCQYKYFDPDNAEWTYEADRTDPYMSEVFKLIEKTDSNDEDSEDEEKLSDHRLLPPCLTNFEGFYNLLVDMGITEEDLLEPDGKIDAQLKKLFCQDEETVAAVDKWNSRLATLFAWPAAMSVVSLEEDDPSEGRAEDPFGASTSRGRTTQNTVDVKTEQTCDCECNQLAALDLTGQE